MTSNGTDIKPEDSSSISIRELIREVDVRNTEGKKLSVLGINIAKEFIPTVANTDGVDLRKYKIIHEGDFVFSGMQTGRDMCIRLGLYMDSMPALVSPAYSTFTVTNPVVLSEYLYLYFVRKEMDRYGAFISDSSVRANLDWPRFLDIKIPVPDIETQRHLVEVWKGLDAIKTDNEALASPLMNLCMSYLDEVRKEYPLFPLNLYIQTCDGRNTANDYSKRSVKGISIDKKFIETKANLNGVNLTSYKLVNSKEFAFVTVTSRNGEKISLALNESSQCYLVSASYEVFAVKSDDLLPEYLYLWFLRPEFDRYARYHSWGSARETFNIEDMARVTIPVPPLSIQQAIVDIYTCARESREIAVEAGELSKQACPALIRRGTYSIAS